MSAVMYATSPHVRHRAVHDLAAPWSYYVDVIVDDLNAEKTLADEFFLQVHLNIVDRRSHRSQYIGSSCRALQWASTVIVCDNDLVEG
jgi:hypothetical protein